jgi:hypothetical protein
MKTLFIITEPAGKTNNPHRKLEFVTREQFNALFQ